MCSKRFEEFKNTVDAMSEEWLKERGAVTCEISLGIDNIDVYLAYLAEKNMQLEDSWIQGKWVTYFCETCKEHDPSRPIHAEIIRGFLNGNHPT